jgi:hypothetical protein
MMISLVGEASWTEEELEALQAEIDRVRKERNNSHVARNQERNSGAE